ncbi:hypothetical protein ElyMa_002152300 [Elysia marginata]|uniref:Uncharacterized protein n=1 Tax=Elysia marginata TaxID=1093978 RepID=A0AAV4FMT6_9GAST|nr:hypothetical protein ElyMa_002152300 [Elysia marginata]
MGSTLSPIFSSAALKTFSSNRSVPCTRTCSSRQDTNTRGKRATGPTEQDGAVNSRQTWTKISLSSSSEDGDSGNCDIVNVQDGWGRSQSHSRGRISPLEACYEIHVERCSSRSRANRTADDGKFGEPCTLSKPKTLKNDPHCGLATPVDTAYREEKYPAEMRFEDKGAAMDTATCAISSKSNTSSSVGLMSLKCAYRKENLRDNSVIFNQNFNKVRDKLAREMGCVYAGAVILVDDDDQSNSGYLTESCLAAFEDDLIRQTSPCLPSRPTSGRRGSVISNCPIQVCDDLPDHLINTHDIHSQSHEPSISHLIYQAEDQDSVYPSTLSYTSEKEVHVLSTGLGQTALPRGGLSLGLTRSFTSLNHLDLPRNRWDEIENCDNEESVTQL